MRYKFKSLFIIPIILGPLLINSTQVSAQKINIDPSRPEYNYCKTTNFELFAGSLKNDDNGDTWIQIAIDDDFIKYAEHDLGLNKDKLSISPIYDLAIRIKPNFNYYCIPNWLSKNEVVAEDLPQILPVSGSLQLIKKGSTDTSGYKILEKGIFERTNMRDESGTFIYEWKIKGFPNGIAQKDKLERLILSLDEGYQSQPVFVLEMKDLDKKNKIELSPVSFSSCTPILGNGPLHISYSRTARSNLDINNFIKNSLDNSKYFNNLIEPLRTYRANFAHHIDLKKVTSGSNGNSNFKSSGKVSGFFEDIENNSSCGNSKIIFAYSGQNIADIFFGNSNKVKNVNGFAIKGEPVILVKDNASPDTLVHEAGHSLGYLDDEYFVDQFGPISKIINQTYNCSENPQTDFNYNNIQYGGTNYKGCLYTIGYESKDSNGNINRTYKYRPANSSIMGSSQSRINKFNTVSCGYMIAGIVGGNAKDYWEQCQKLDTVDRNISSNKSNDKYTINQNYLSDFVISLKNKLTTNVLDSGSTTANSTLANKCYVNLDLRYSEDGNGDINFTSINSSPTSENLYDIANTYPRNDLYYTLETFVDENNNATQSFIIPTSNEKASVIVDTEDGGFVWDSYDENIRISIPSTGNISKIQIGIGDKFNKLNVDENTLNCGSGKIRLNQTASQFTIAQFTRGIFDTIFSGVKYTLQTVNESLGDVLSIKQAPTPTPGIISAVKKINSDPTLSGSGGSSGSSGFGSGGSTPTGSSPTTGSGSTNSTTTPKPNTTSTVNPTPTSTTTPKPTSTATPSPASTATPTPTSTVPNPTPTSTATPSSASTATPTPTPTPTGTPISPLPDTTAPTVSITSPTNNSTIGGTVTLSATAQDPIIQGRTTSGILGVQFKLDNINLGPEVTTSPYSGAWNTLGVTIGNHTLTAVARDFAGNTTTSNPIYITVSNTTSSQSPTPTPNSNIPTSVTPTPTPSNSPQASTVMQIASIYETLRWIFEQMSQIDGRNK